MGQKQAKLERRYLRQFNKGLTRKAAERVLAEGRGECVTHRDHARLNRMLKRGVA